MGRPHIEFIQSQDVPAETIEDGPFAGARRRLLSADDETGAWTALVELPAAWQVDLAGCDRPMEVLGLEGQALVGGTTLAPGGYCFLAPTAASRVLSTSDGAKLLVMLEAQSALVDDADVTVLDTTHMPWMDRTLPEVPAGLTVKLLRKDEHTHERTWMAALVPGWTEMRAEQHPTVEEAFILRGDGLLGSRGRLTGGAYFWRPPMVEHGPMTTRGGQLVFFRTKGGDLDVSYVEVPEAQAMVDDYHRSAPFYDAGAAPLNEMR